MINYTEKGAGLHALLNTSGYWLREENRVWISNNDEAVQLIIDAYPLAQYKKEVKLKVKDFAISLRGYFFGKYSTVEIASWAGKLVEAADFYRTGGNRNTCPVLIKESSIRGISLEELVSKVEIKAAFFADVECKISGISGKHRDAISKLKTFEAVTNYDFTEGWPKV